MTREKLHALLTTLTAQTLGDTPDITFTVDTAHAGDRDGEWLESDIDVTVPIGSKEDFRELLKDLTEKLAEDAAWQFDPEEDVDEADDGWRLTVVVYLDD